MGIWPVATSRGFLEVGVASLRRDPSLESPDSWVAGTRVAAICETLGDGRGAPHLTLAATSPIRRLDDVGDPASVPALLAALTAASLRVRRLLADPSVITEWGCSVAVALLAGRRLILASVGTTCCYLVSGGVLTHVVQDETWPAAPLGATGVGDGPAAPARRLPLQWLGNPHLVPTVTAVPARHGDIVGLFTGAVAHSIGRGPVCELLVGSRSPSVTALDIARTALGSGAYDGASALLAVIE